MSQLELLDEKLSQEDVNQKLLRSLSPEWNTHAVVWRNKANLDTMSMDDLYNNLKVYELEVKGMSSSSSSTQNMAFSDQTEEGPNYALMAFSSLSFDSEVSNGSICSMSCLETNELLKYQNDQLLKDLKKYELMVLRYKTSLESVEENLERGLTIRELRKKLEKVQKEKDGIQLNVDKFEHASKSLNKLIECQIVDNCKKGLGYEKYNAVPPLYTGNFMPPTPDLSFTGLDEFINEHVVENCKAMSSEEEPKVVRKYDDVPSIEEWVSDDEEEDVSQPKLKRKQLGLVLTLNEAARTMLADSKLPTTFWAEAVNTACYMQNRVLVVKPHNKTPYELFHGRTPTLSFIRPFGCLVTILNTIDHLGKFDSKADECFFVGYSLNSKAFRVFNSRTRIVEENLHIRFSESTPNVVGSGPDWLFDIDALTRIMNYEPIVAGTQSNGFADLKSSHDDGSKPSSDDGKKVDEDLRKDSECKDQDKEDNVNSTNNVNTVSSTLNATCTNEVNVVGGKTSIKVPFDLNVPTLEDYSIFNFSRDDEDDGAVADMNNLDTIIQVSHNPTTRIHKDHPLDQVIGDLQSTTQTRNMLKNLEEHGFEEPKKVIHALKDPSWIEAMQEELLQFKLQEVWTLQLGYFLDYASFKDFVVYQMDMKSAFLYGKTEEEVYVCQPPGFEDPDFPHRVYKVENALYRLHQAPRAWYETLSTYLLDNRFLNMKIDKTLSRQKVQAEIAWHLRVMHENFSEFDGRTLLLLGLHVKQKKVAIYS
ncbi:putative ribonuclease H-like domain-containing protein [Tanacetum coccineum]